MEFLSRVLAGLYIALPPLTAGLIAWRHRRSPQPQYARAAGGFVCTCVAGMIIGVALTLIYAGPSTAVRRSCRSRWSATSRPASSACSRASPGC